MITLAAMGHRKPESLNILLVIFDVALKNLKHTYFLTSSDLVTVNRREDKRIVVEKYLT